MDDESNGVEGEGNENKKRGTCGEIGRGEDVKRRTKEN